MRRFAIALLALIALAAPAIAQQVFPQIPTRARAFGATSGNVAAATATATLGVGNDGTQVYICGFSVRSLGATAATTVTLTITGLLGNFSYSYFAVAGVSTANQPADVYFSPCLPASGPDTAIVVSLPSLGAGNTNAYVNAWGYRY